jgi:conjugative relaxase-like TrwC/TraI family protein
MLNIQEITDANAAKEYYQHSDYYLEVAGEWLGKFASDLDLKGKVEQPDFEAVCDNINPKTGQRLTLRNKDNRRVGWDFNFNASKSVSLAREIIGLYDPAEGQRIEDAHREAVGFVVGMMERDIACRLRDGGKDEDEVTGNGIFMRVTHRTTRPNEDDKTPDPELHDHVLLLNATRSPDGKVKAVQTDLLYRSAPYYEAMYHNRLAANLKELGYGVVRKGKWFEIAGVTAELIDKYSRRSKTIKAKAKELGITDAESIHKLGATTRLAKSEGMVDDMPGYWDGKLTDPERDLLRGLKGHNSGGYESTVEKSVAYAIKHEFTRKSVVDARRVYETAMRHGVGSVTPEDVEAEAKRQGLLVRKSGLATTKAVLEQERVIVTFGAEGRARWQPLSVGGKKVDLSGLSPEQANAVKHIWRSSDRAILIEGDAGTGKTDAMKVTIPGIDRPGVFLAPSASASRGTLREKGFENADTIKRFLTDDTFSEQARKGYIYIDEAPLATMEDMANVFRKADELGARVILQGDRKQHGSVNRSGAFTLLEKYAGLPVARLSEIWRQQHKGYKDAVAAIAKGNVLGGFDKLDGLGWVKDTPEGGGHTALVDEYMQALKDKASVLVVCPTHKEGEEITQAIRERLKAAGLVGTEEKTFVNLKPLAWTDAERGDASRYGGTEVVQFSRNCGKFRAGQRVDAPAFDPGKANPEHFAVYAPGEISLAKGDAIRITANGRDKSGKHKLNNGSIYRVKGFTGKGEITLHNGWVLDKNFAHIAHGRVVTSHASQGMTVDRVLVAMGKQSLPAISREQFYVSVSRARQKATLFTTIAREQLREAIQRGDDRITATEFMQAEDAKEKPKAFPAAILKLENDVRSTYRHLRQVAEQNAMIQAMRQLQQERQIGHEL